MNVKFIVALGIGVCFLIGCSQRSAVEFADEDFYDILPYSTIVSYVKCHKFELNNKCGFFDEEFSQLDYSEFLTYQDGIARKLNLMTEPMTKYIRSDSSDKFLALTLYLFEKDYSSKKLFDEMLEFNLRMDSLNLIAGYELSKLRFKEGYIGLAAFLIDNMCENYPDYNVLSELQENLYQAYGKNLYDSSMSFQEYFELNPHYTFN